MNQIPLEVSFLVLQKKASIERDLALKALTTCVLPWIHKQTYATSFLREEYRMGRLCYVYEYKHPYPKLSNSLTTTCKYISDSKSLKSKMYKFAGRDRFQYRLE